MTESELLIKIRTALESGGLDAANSKLKELTGTTNTASVSTGKHHAELDKAAKAIQGIKAATEGNVGALVRLINETGTATSIFAKAIPVVAAFWAGWHGGTKVQTFLWDQLVGKVKDVGEVAVKTKDEFKSLNDVKLSGITAEVEGIARRLERAVRALNEIEARTKAESSAESEKQIAAIEADQTRSDPEKQRLIAEIKNRAAKQEFDAVDEASNKREGSLRQAKEETDLRIKAAREEIAAAERNKKIAEERYAASPLSNARMKALREARFAAGAAQETFGAALPGLEDKSADLQSQIEKEESVQRIAKTNLVTADFRRTSTLSAATAAEQSIAQKQAKEQADAAAKAETAARKAEEESANMAIGSQEEELDLARGVLPSLESKLMRNRAAASAAGAAATPRKGVLGGGVSAAQKKAASDASTAAKQSERDLQEMVSYIQAMANAISDAKQQIKNSSRGG